MKLQNLKGTKDYLPKDQIVRNKIIDILRENFEKYGYKPIETSILDYWEIGASKYAGGEEILKETYKLQDQGERNLLLRYELTFKLAKLIGMNPNLRMPFKRYEIGKVFRDGPVKTGRLREFKQCDIDVIGLETRAIDAELVKMVFDILNQLKLDGYVQINSRQLLFGMFEYAGINDLEGAALSLDKLEKIGADKVKQEMQDKGINNNAINKIFESLDKMKGKPNNEIIKMYETMNNDNIKQGLTEIKEFIKYIDVYGLKNVKLTPTLARGLGYYTGLMWEFYVKNNKMTSSIAAGGRWDNMIQNFLGTKRKYPATGLSFGLAAVQAALENNNDIISNIIDLYLIPVSDNEIDDTIKIADQLRSKINCDIAYGKNISKGMKYADKENIPYVMVIGEEELNTNKFTLKNMKTGKEEKTDLTGIKKSFE